MDRSPLNDAGQYPDDAVLAAHLGTAKPAWDEFVTGAGAVEGVELTWRYYQDGKAWLCKVTRRGKTICWVSVWDGSFKATFYFTEKADRDIAQLEIDPGLRQTYASASRSGALKPLTVQVTQREQLADVYELMRYKARR